MRPSNWRKSRPSPSRPGYGSPFASSGRAFTEVNVINKTTKLPLVIRSVRPDSIRRPKTDLLTLSPLEAMRHLPTLWYSYKGPRWRVPWPANLGGMINSRALVLAASLVWQVVSVGFQALLGVACLRSRVGRDLRRSTAAGAAAAP